VPPDAHGAVALSASLNYRKFTRDYSIFVQGPGAQALPVTRICRDAVTLPVGSGAPDKVADPKAAMAARGNKDAPWLRWNDYGIGLLLQGDLKGAGKAFERAAALGPEKPDGPLNLARARIQEGDLPAAKAALAEAEKRRPGWPKTAFFRAFVSKEEGRVEDAIADALRVDRAFPKDRLNLNGIARLLYVSGKYAEALPFIDRVLAIDGEDLAAHYNAMLCLKALGRREEASAEEAWYRYFKDDEAARSVTASWRHDHPYDNRESLPIHVHDEAAPPPAPKPAWLAEIGPKGYAYRGAAPPNEMVLHDDRPKGAQLPLSRPDDAAKSAKLAAAIPPVAFVR
jgi:tetratricopeptide (TPR) repeat protein